MEPNAGASALEEKVNAIHPIKLGQEEEDDDAKEMQKGSDNQQT